MQRIAVVGAGIAGLAAARQLSQRVGTEVVLLEAQAWAGGHAHTVDIRLPDATGTPVEHGVDTGFLVFNRKTYPRLIELFQQLGVATAEADMSFSVQVAAADLEWAGTSLRTLFAQWRNLTRPAFLHMLADLLRFNRLATSLVQRGHDERLNLSISDFLDQHRFGTAFRDWYLLPMVGSIWSCSAEQMLRFPVGTMLRFCNNHGLLQVNGRPQWYGVAGGSRNYVARMLTGIHQVRLGVPVRAIERRAGGNAGVLVVTDRVERFDELVLACHSDQALALLGVQASPAERRMLSAIGYQSNRTVLHTDTSVLPRRAEAWAAWNYEHAADPATERAAVCVHYLLNKLQRLPFAQPVIVSLNPVREPRAECILDAFDVAHPLFDQAAVAAQSQLSALQGQRHTWFCGAWAGYGFHEDGLVSGLNVAAAMTAAMAGAAPAQAA